MATVKVICPKCVGLGITGSVSATRCSQCSGTGTISIDDTQTLSALNTTVAATGTPLVFTAAPMHPAAAVKIRSQNDSK